MYFKLEYAGTCFKGLVRQNNEKYITMYCKCLIRITRVRCIQNETFILRKKLQAIDII